MDVMMLCWAVLLLLIFLVTHALSSSSSSTSSYTPVTALDKFGNAQQVRHAREAAMQHGRLVMAAKYHNTASATATATAEEKDGDENKGAVIVVLTVVEERPDLVESSVSESSTVPRTVHLLNHVMLPPSFVESQQQQSSSSSSLHHDKNHSLLALACTGVKPDAVWLLETIRDYVKRMWERYDTWHYSVDEMTAAVSQAMGSFWNHPRQQEWNHGAGPVVLNNDDDDDDENDHGNAWSRPLGVQALILSTNPNDPLVVVEPSGVAQSSSTALAIGQDSHIILPLLTKKLKARAVESCDELINTMIETVEESLGSFKAKLLIEILSSNGIERRWHQTS